MATKFVHQSEASDVYAIAMAKPRGGKSLDPELHARALRALREFVEAEGDQAAAADKLGISQGFLSEVLNGGRGAGPKLLKGLAQYRPDIVSLFMGVEPTPTRTVHYDSDEAWREAARRAGHDPDDPNVATAFQAVFKNLEGSAVEQAERLLGHLRAAEKDKALGTRPADDLEAEELAALKRGKKKGRKK